jgi:GT2 family glycosyltransferase
MYYYDEPDVIWYAGSYVNLVTSQTKNIGCNEKDKGQYDQVRKTQFAPTAYLATRESVEKLKGHNEDLFMTYGDTDYGFRAMEAGFKVMFCPKAKLWHHLSKNANNNTIRALGYNLPMRAYYFARNRVIFMKRHASLLNYLFFLVFIFPVITLIISFKIITLGGSLNLLKIHLLGSFDGYRFAFGASPKNIFK